MSNSLVELPAWPVDDPDEARIRALATDLAALDGTMDEAGTWSEELWTLVKQAGAPRWSLPAEFGGDACSRSILVQRYARLAESNLTAVFILSQHDAAVRRLATAADRPVARQWLRAIDDGSGFATVGISHLTTSRRLGAQPLVADELRPGVYLLDGAMPWVTAAGRADLFVTGAVLGDGQQLLIALPADRPGVTVRPPFPLAALQASCTTEVILERVEVDDSDILAGPTMDISTQPGAVGTAGLETSALALGQARAALGGLAGLASERIDLVDPVDVLCETWQQCWSALISCARGDQEALSASQVRAQSNALVLRSTQAYLAARKGSGFLRTEPAQRWARQALFFLVWSCPTPIAQAAIRELAGLCPS